jgi:hypothetical protein
MPTPVFNIAADAPATFAAYAWLVDKVDTGPVVPESETDEYVGAVWGNGVDEALIQVNEVFLGVRPIVSLDIGDGTGSPRLELDKSSVGTSTLHLASASTSRGHVSLGPDHVVAVVSTDADGITALAGDYRGQRTTTTDAVATTIWSAVLADNSTYAIDVMVAAMQSDGSDRAVYIRRALVFRDGGGATLSGGGVVAVWTDETSASWDCTIDTNSNSVRVRITGAAGRTIQRVPHIRFVQVV